MILSSCCLWDYWFLFRLRLHRLTPHPTQSCQLQAGGGGALQGIVGLEVFQRESQSGSVSSAAADTAGLVLSWFWCHPQPVFLLGEKPVKPAGENHAAAGSEQQGETNSGQRLVLDSWFWSSLWGHLRKSETQHHGCESDGFCWTQNLDSFRTRTKDPLWFWFL